MITLIFPAFINLWEG